MNRLILLVVRALSLIAATGVTVLIISVHAAYTPTLGARDAAASRAPVIVHMEKTSARPVAHVAFNGGHAH
jgi:hypothetical protein